ncbi:glutamate-ammonia-ligase adenylyltransferase [Cryobacterium mesophilum]|uniref:Bifunctional [glutamine synthetase] adenylyltransferase/[glutamine synthetase]-adenylyl-L-tyrosine phosphorylase n=1 Tax=Terrimesophilobacter mesophilus TaxID=433647 RepID=A0A4R8V8U9_9MICO|nr:bifunctional [glutamine synthetase] adenylyltransferase/[glutamine synthetase]-adenylyl-L-tyrosine phosphorylase [Terrimesophilobacter mesophilus]MBB5631808.1 glutamate-ammonia-ligase adenylyltransferase [Terrimesophilobacter mesophilus]TFB78726.1 bifunctional [glutamine synthetase] adenylyltransferase/[glutamine synthetase]-adenylyl-L-tyrosine phosphorylase [Terrimesophilobacter mesophilus]
MARSLSSDGRASLTELARLGFSELAAAGAKLAAFDPSLVGLFAASANPDQALNYLVHLRDQSPDQLARALSTPDAAQRLIRVLGASAGLGEFFRRRPSELESLADPLTGLPPLETMRSSLVSAVEDALSRATGPSANGVDDAIVALRVRYRSILARIAAFDLEQIDQLSGVEAVAGCLSDLAAAVIDAALELARRHVPFAEREVEATRLSVIGMGKAGAHELNYLSDVDVIYVLDADASLSPQRALEIGTRLAIELARAIQGPSSEPELWEVDANLRPEGKDGALVRTLDSHLAYYDRWAKAWEFQALLKARPLAGDRELGDRYVAAISPLVWTSAGRANFVESVQHMRERVTEHIPPDERDVQLKLGRGGLRDVEFTIQLLQLVHGQVDDGVRQAGTLPALVALAERGYIGREEAATFARDYRFLRLLEHRIQLSTLKRSHLMPRDEGALRVLARGSGLASSAADLLDQWQAVKTEVRTLHERLFYRPLLSAVAGLPEEGFALTSEQASARLAAIGFTDPDGALRHIGALTAGLSRRATIQRNLLPILLQWFAEGTDPDHGLLVFRRLSDALGESHWYLRMLRDSSGAAHRLTQVLSGSRFVGDLFEKIPESVAWLEDDDDLAPRPIGVLLEEGEAIIARHSDDPDAAAQAVRTARRREILRLALASILGLVSVQQLGRALTDVTTSTIRTALAIARRRRQDEIPAGMEFAVIGMGRFGGQELGFGSDADVIYVYRAPEGDGEAAQKAAERLVADLNALTEDVQVPLELDIDLRPEGKNGPVARSLDSYSAYYARWSLTWEAQALLRAHGVAGDETLITGFQSLADGVRYPASISDSDLREVKRIKARVESERLPQGAEPSRHLKLGRGSLSDVEWLVQLLQLRHGAAIEGLRTTSTLDALAVAQESDLLTASEARMLREAWIFASRTRSALTLWTSKTTDVLPNDRAQLDGVARLMGYPPGSASRLEDDYLRVTRRARKVFEERFYGKTGHTP